MSQYYSQYDGYNPGYNQGYSYDPNMTTSLTNHFYKLSSQTNLVIFGYVLLMGINHMIVGEMIYNENYTFDAQKKNWLFSAILFSTIINCIVLLLLKEKKRPVTQTPKGATVAPIMFTIFQIIILSCSLGLFFMGRDKFDTRKQVMTILTFLGLSSSVILSVWGFASSVCSINRY
jgi:hypothetical protein